MSSAITGLRHKLMHATISKGLADRQFKFVISSESVDRDRDIIRLDAWDLKEYLANPVVLASHDHQRLPVGKSVDIGVRGDKLKATVEFPPKGIYDFADCVHDMVEAGFLKAASVGFRATDSEPNGLGGMTIKKATLLEWSICSIGSNSDAMVERSAPLMMQKWLQSTPSHHKEHTMHAHTDELYLEVADDFYEQKAEADLHDLDRWFESMLQQMLAGSSDQIEALLAAQLIAHPEAAAAMMRAMARAGVVSPPKSWRGDGELLDIDDKQLAVAIARVVADEVGAQTRSALYAALGRLD